MSARADLCGGRSANGRPYRDLSEKLAGPGAAPSFPANFLCLISSLLNGPWRKIVAVFPFPQC
jgi:hypothetical protein